MKSVIQRWIQRVIVTLVVLCALTYVGDWIVLQLREHWGSAHGQVVVDDADVLKEKGGKVEYFYNPPQPTACVRTLFPHEGQPACWWLTRHSDQQQFIN
jgi:hypothetical protein